MTHLRKIMLEELELAHRRLGGSSKGSYGELSLACFSLVRDRRLFAATSLKGRSSSIVCGTPCCLRSR